jgi:hypothetical protein
VHFRQVEHAFRLGPVQHGFSAGQHEDLYSPKLFRFTHQSVELVERHRATPRGGTGIAARTSQVAGAGRGDDEHPGRLDTVFRFEPAPRRVLLCTQQSLHPQQGRVFHEIAGYHAPLGDPLHSLEDRPSPYLEFPVDARRFAVAAPGVEEQPGEKPGRPHDRGPQRIAPQQGGHQADYPLAPPGVEKPACNRSQSQGKPPVITRPPKGRPTPIETRCCPSALLSSLLPRCLHKSFHYS